MDGELTPWWLAMGGGAITALAGVIGKLWTDQRKEATAAAAVAAEEARELRAALAAANARNVELQRSSQDEHVRDLRRIAGLTASFPPPIIQRRRPP